MKFGRVFLLVAVLGLCACEKQPQSNAGERVASWGTGFVLKAELDHAVEQLGKVDEKQMAKVSAQALEELINQKLIYSAAEKSGLTSNPAVQLDEELARRKVVARAYVQHLAANLPKPTSQEIDLFYSGNPQLFSKRRVYQLQEVRVLANRTRDQAVRAQLAKSKNLGDLIGWLKSQGLPFTVQGGVKAAEQLPDGLRGQLAGMSARQIAIFPADDGMAILLVQGVQDQPLTREQATPVIETLLLAKKQKEAIETDIKKMRDAEKIEYASRFEQTAKQ